MLANSRVVAFLATTDPTRTRAFFEDTLGLRFVEDSPFALVFDLGGTTLRIQKVKELSAPPYTALGWSVTDLGARVRDLSQRGVRFVRYDFMDQDDHGIWTAPDGTRVAWFQDPDGHTLSLSEP